MNKLFFLQGSLDLTCGGRHFPSYLQVSFIYKLKESIYLQIKLQSDCLSYWSSSLELGIDREIKVSEKLSSIGPKSGFENFDLKILYYFDKDSVKSDDNLLSKQQ